jgi:hypothetical protein
LKGQQCDRLPTCDVAVPQTLTRFILGEPGMLARADQGAVAAWLLLKQVGEVLNPSWGYWTVP